MTWLSLPQLQASAFVADTTLPPAWWWGAADSRSASSAGATLSAAAYAVAAGALASVQRAFAPGSTLLSLVQLLPHAVAASQMQRSDHTSEYASAPRQHLAASRLHAVLHGPQLCCFVHREPLQQTGLQSDGRACARSAVHQHPAQTALYVACSADRSLLFCPTESSTQMTYFECLTSLQTVSETPPCQPHGSLTAFRVPMYWQFNTSRSRSNRQLERPM